MERLLKIANDLGYLVFFCGMPPGLLAATMHDLRRIFVDSRLTDSEQLGHLAHEIGHIHHNHPHARDPRTAAELANERLADRHAARLLIDPSKYAALEAVNPDQHELADELGVPVEYVYVYESDCLTRVRGITYAHARDGIGQWSHRGEVA